LKDQELMSKSKYFGLERGATSKALPNWRKEWENDRERVACKL